ncbi:MAG: hypothetical protein KKB31_05680 [Nanoarchaeota archaeon]|nr:hypothetical protein [Nanoarchaeota archaeon]
MAFWAVLAAPEIIAAIIGLVGLMLQNKWLVLIGAGMFIYFLGGVIDIPFYIWIIIAIIFFYWITSQGGKKK